MLKPEQVPKEVVEAYVKAYESYPPKSRQECIAAAINAWPGMTTRTGLHTDLILPLPQEGE